MRELASKGRRLESIQTAKQYRLNQGFNSDIFCEEIISLLCTDKEKRARRLFQKYFPTKAPLSPLAWKLDRFLFSEKVQELGQTTLSKPEQACITISIDITIRRHICENY